MTDLGWDPLRSRAVLIGTSSYQYLPAVGPASNSLDRMRKVLTSGACKWPVDRVTVISDIEKPGELPDELVELFADVDDVALFYYVGHGLLDDLDRLCLCLVDTRPDANRRRTTGLPFDAVRHAYRQSQAKTKIIILDCCYAGMAEPRTLGHEALVERAGVDGTFTMCAAGEFDLAWYETDPAADLPQTYFTKYLLNVIETGVEGAGEYLRLDVIFTEAQAALERAQKPVPTSTARHRAPRMAFARNVHADAIAAPEHPRRAISTTKILVVGGFGAGKTTFVASASDIAPVHTSAELTRDSGEDVNRLRRMGMMTTTTTVLDYGRTEVDGTVAHLFAPPGQTRYWFLWEDLLRGVDTAVVIVDSRRLADSFAAIDFLEYRRVPYVVAINHFGNLRHHEEQDIREALVVGPEIQIVGCDVRRRRQTRVALEKVVELFRQGLPRASVPAAWPIPEGGYASRVTDLTRVTFGWRSEHSSSGVPVGDVTARGWILQPSTDTASQ